MTLVCVWLAFLLTSNFVEAPVNIRKVEAEVRKNVSFPIPVDDNFLCQYVRFGKNKGESDPNPLLLRQSCSNITSYGKKYPDGKKYQVLPSPSGRGFLMVIYDVRLKDAGQYQLVVGEREVSTKTAEIRNYLIQLIVNKSSGGGKLENAEKNPRGKGENNTSNKLEPVTHPIGPTVVISKHFTATPPMSPTNNDASDPSVTNKKLLVVAVVVVVVVSLVAWLCCKKRNRNDVSRMERGEYRGSSSTERVQPSIEEKDSFLETKDNTDTDHSSDIPKTDVNFDEADIIPEAV